MILYTVMYKRNGNWYAYGNYHELDAAHRMVKALKDLHYRHVRIF